MLNFQSAFDLFSNPFFLVEHDTENDLARSLYFNSSFSIEFLESSRFKSADEFAEQIISQIKSNNYINDRKQNLIVNIHPDSLEPVYYRISVLKKSSLYMISLESLSRFDDPSWNNILTQNSAIVYSTKPYGDYSFNFISDNVKEILGYESSKFVKANDFWDSLIAPDYKAYTINTLQNLDNSREVRMVYPIRNSNGDYRWFEERAKMVRNTDGSAKEIVGLVFDVNDQKLKFDNQRKALQELRAILNTIPGIILVFDKNLNLIDYSESVKAIINRESDSNLKGLNINELFCDVSHTISKNIEYSINTNQAFERETNEKENAYFGDIYKIKVNPVVGDDGDVWAAVLSMICIGHFIEKEQKLNDLVKSLEFARAAEENQTKKIKALLEEIDSSRHDLIEMNNQKDKFFSIIAHDLRTPLKGFMQLTKILSSEYGKMSDTEVLEMMTSMYESSQNLYKLLDNLLEWSRIQSGKIQYNPITMQLSTLIMMNIDLLIPTAKQKNIRLVNQVSSKCLVYTDVNIINTVIRNLISNSLKFSFPGSEIVINAHTYDDRFVEICVSDSGTGMSEIVRDKLFKLDCHITSKGTGEETGSGLGLILCNDLVKLNGGNIRVESKLNEGTRIYFTVPSRENKQ
ncbi:MAG: PAS domain-containing sensor histidine kinase [Candidatus Kapaibacterium sp.]